VKNFLNSISKSNFSPVNHLSVNLPRKARIQQGTANGTWQPSHRRSKETGEILSHWCEGESVVPAVMPPDFADAPPPDDASRTDRVELFRRVITILEDGPARSMAVRLATLKYLWKIEGLSLRNAAKKANCNLSALFREMRRMKQILPLTVGKK
jgi:hypothetical protein